ncbi:DUF3810 domain-containing protein [candidate division KSB1 bacterium]|nr:DUF3810 domain-containing protein [candidate division KSB1 bacterium]NIR72110.1 DUF3810 domain-containing protein [candidate division KSB1 bacterium]NIS26052.1 DUF3810 domain-containing protein [candidate division KSB1 bacterium]NIT71943.1 DUF3810 domain-containing protein [candidate division KSB1 bacterium]NIU25687.1 DUF3810 domain-containing protein [candidate division KSB1 bacterium]
MKSPTKLRAGIIGLALTFYLLLQLLAQFPEFVEQYYSNGLYPFLTLWMSNFSGQFYFSVTEFTLWGIILFGIPFVIHRIRKKRMHITRLLLNLMTMIAVIYVWFYLFWGINYFRQPLKAKLNLENVQLPMDAFDSTFVDIIKQCNNLNLTYSIDDVNEINAEIDSSYDAILEKLQLKNIPGFKGLKSFVVNWLLNKTTTSGWFSPLFHEVHYNTDLLIFELPFGIAHEKAHQMGYTSEAEANFLAYLVCTNSGDRLCQYSGYFNVLRHFFATIKDDSSKKEYFKASLNSGVKFNLNEVRERWESHQGWISRLSRRGYDLYLKSNNVKEGVANYSLVVDYIVRFNEQKELKFGWK